MLQELIAGPLGPEVNGQKTYLAYRGDDKVRRSVENMIPRPTEQTKVRHKTRQGTGEEKRVFYFLQRREGLRRFDLKRSRQDNQTYFATREDEVTRPAWLTEKGNLSYLAYIRDMVRTYLATGEDEVTRPA